MSLLLPSRFVNLAPGARPLSEIASRPMSGRRFVLDGSAARLQSRLEGDRLFLPTMQRDRLEEPVQLPHGTDVVTRVDREAAGEVVASGTVGRVVGTSPDSVDLQVLGVGVVRYDRSEVTPFRSGQVRYALARDAAWNALRANAVLETTVGSHA